MNTPNMNPNKSNHLSTWNPAKQIVVNWHITEACNYGCDFCYAKWGKPKQRELLHDQPGTQRLLEQVYSLFRAGGTPVRLNLAGGEPLLYPDELKCVVAMAKEIGFDVSIITNGSRLNLPLLGFLAENLSMVGISVDSSESKVNLSIGRADKRGGALLTPAALQSMFEHVRSINADITLKINTVVNLFNWQENMSRLIACMSPDRWKVLQALPIHSPRLAVTSRQFAEFVDRHANLSNIMSVEDNESMTESYIMIDPVGRFFQNTQLAGAQYSYSQPILTVGARAAFSELVWCERKFASRYTTVGAPLLRSSPETNARNGPVKASAPRRSHFPYLNGPKNAGRSVPTH